MNFVVVSTVSYKNIGQVTPPTILVCPKDHYDWFASKHIGYPYRYTFFLGMVDEFNGNLSWGGENNSLTFEESLQALFKASFDTFSIDPDTIVLENKFIIPYGNCKMLQNYSLDDI